MQILTVFPKALMVSVIQPLLFPSIRQSHQFARQKVPGPAFFQDVAASLDRVAGFQSVDCDTHSGELSDIGTFNGPQLRVSVLALCLNIKKAVRIDSLKPNDSTFQCDARCGIE